MKIGVGHLIACVFGVLVVLVVTVVTVIIILGVLDLTAIIYHTDNIHFDDLFVRDSSENTNVTTSNLRKCMRIKIKI